MDQDNGTMEQWGNGTMHQKHSLHFTLKQALRHWSKLKNNDDKRREITTGDKESQRKEA
jgi:hypothetical protein